MKAGLISYSLVNNILKAIVGLFFSKVLESSIFDGQFIFFQLYMLIDDLISEIISAFHLISS